MLRIPEQGGNKDNPRIFSVNHYKELARFISLNQLEWLWLDGFLYSSTLTIQPFADAIREQTSMKRLHLHEKTKNMGGLEDIRYLLLNGLAPNVSITEFWWNGFRGDSLYALIGEMLSRNKAITSAHFVSVLPSDLEALNRFGKGIENNQIIKKVTLTFGVHLYAHEDYWTTYPLPGRPAGMTTEDLSGFTQGIVNNTSLTSIEFVGGHTHVRGYPSVIKAIKAIHRPGLKVRVSYLMGSPEGAQKDMAGFPYDEWEG